ncbi:MAG TPA: DUF2238 domain-containing protein [Dongiaceae bacterium]|nr:DUF2238 domain-containing protein [Dongiaceae bacterium]
MRICAVWHHAASSRGRYLLVLAVLLLALWIALAVAPFDRADWALENALAVVFVVVLAVSYKSFPLSRISYSLIFLFLVLHEVGAHYTYSEVPYRAWFQALAGSPADGPAAEQRNHFDRFVHFSYGLLLAYPIRELFCRVANARGFWGYFLPLDVTMSTSMLFELFEWAAAEIFGGDLGIAYLGTQGDVWDAHKDMALASLGAALAMGATALLNVWLQRDFAREWAESLRVKHSAPLGEDEIARLRRRR